MRNTHDSAVKVDVTLSSTRASDTVTPAINSAGAPTMNTQPMFRTNRAGT